MSLRSTERRRLLQKAVHGFAQAHPDYTLARIEREIAQAVSLSRSSVQKWRAGQPVAYHHVPHLAVWAVQQAGMDLAWLRAFLRQCKYASSDLETRLFVAEHSQVPAPNNAPRQRVAFPTPEYTQLFGVQPLMQKLLTLLSAHDGPRLISLEGLGGIGKTALARAIVNHLEGDTAQFKSICWISARHAWITPQGELESLDDPACSVDDVVTRLAEQLGQIHLAGFSTTEKLSRLQPLLTAEPHLVIVDNLETLTDAQALLPALQPLTGSSRFLFTSRHTLRHFPYVHILAVPRLSLPDSDALVRSELERRGHVTDLPGEALLNLYDLIGGLPLALKLAAAQLGELPIKHILAGLQRAERRTPQTMYTYIYHQTWRQLQNPARELLLALLNISPDGEDLPWIRLTSMLPESQFQAALAQLLDHSLLEITQILPALRYHLHRLTVTFLQSEILLGWGDAESHE